MKEITADQARFMVRVWDTKLCSMIGPATVWIGIDAWADDHPLAGTPHEEGLSFYENSSFEGPIGDRYIPSQCIARKDGEGSWVFEGDVVRFQYGRTLDASELLIAKWENGVLDLFRLSSNARFSTNKSTEPRLKVIGNKWDNPKLLEKSGS